MIAILTPTRGEMDVNYTYSLAQLLLYTKHKVLYPKAVGSILPNLRNELVARALAAQCSHVLFIDSDMGFTPDALDVLMDNERHIIGANCRQRDGERWTAFKDGQFIPRDPSKGIEHVDSIGLAFTLIRAEVFRAFVPPWFGFAWDSTAGKFTGEDVLFTRNARSKGFSICVNHSLFVTHHVTTALA